MKERKIKYKTITGPGTKVDKTIKQYKSLKSNSIDVLLLNSRYYGSGLNLEIMLLLIILYHKMSKEMECQVIGRAQRIGRKKPLKVYKILYECECEQA